MDQKRRPHELQSGIQREIPHQTPRPGPFPSRKIEKCLTTESGQKFRLLLFSQKQQLRCFFLSFPHYSYALIPATTSYMSQTQQTQTPPHSTPHETSIECNSLRKELLANMISVNAFLYELNESMIEGQTHSICSHPHSEEFRRYAKALEEQIWHATQQVKTITASITVLVKVLSDKHTLDVKETAKERCYDQRNTP